ALGGRDRHELLPVLALLRQHKHLLTLRDGERRREERERERGEDHTDGEGGRGVASSSLLRSLSAVSCSFRCSSRSFSRSRSGSRRLRSSRAPSSWRACESEPEELFRAS